MSVEGESPERSGSKESGSKRAFFDRVDHVLTWIFLIGYPKPLCSAIDPKNIGELTKSAEDLDLSKISGPDLKEFLEAAANSQDQAIYHTDYEDGKAGRILAPVAFLTTLGSVLLLKCVDIAEAGSEKTRTIWIASVFVLLVVVGTLTVIWGIVPRFNLPKTQPSKIDRTFFWQIAKVSPERWIDCWKDKTADDLKREEIRSRIVASYLISGKVALKIAMLRRGMLCIFCSLLVLLIGVVNFLCIQISDSIKSSNREGNQMLIAIDADNTLWDTNAVYENAQNGLIKGVCEAAKLSVPADALQSLRVHDQRIAKGHVDGYRYPPAILLEELRKDWAHNGKIEDWEGKKKEIIEAYQKDLRTPPEPFPSLATTLQRLRSRGKLMLVTEGSEDKIRARLKALGIEGSFDGLEFVVKSPLTFLELLKHADGKPAVMIGDQLDRDIEFAGKAGWRTVWIPSKFRPDHEDLTARLELPDVVVGGLSEAPGAVDRLKEKQPAEEKGK